MKVVINSCFGGFGLSPMATVEYGKLVGFDVYKYTQTQYKHLDGQNLYEKVDPLDEDVSILTYIYTQDKGDSFSEIDGEDAFREDDIERNDPNLVEVVERLGEAADGVFAELEVVEVPDNVEWHITEYDGIEYVAENHRTWS